MQPMVERLIENMTPREMALAYERGALLTSRIEIPGIDELRELSCAKRELKRGPRGDQPGKSDPYQKMKTREIARPLLGFKNHILSALTNDLDHARRIQSRMIKIEHFINARIKAWFPEYVWGDKTIGTWRLMETEREWLHFDIYKTSVPLLRIFLNLDTEPRIWGIGPMLEDYCAEYAGEIAVPAINGDKTLGAIAEAASYHIDSHRSAPIIRREFQPGEMWLVQSQIVAHEIIYGRRMYGLAMRYDPASMADPELAPLAMASRLRAKLTAAK
jgi:hypothetical protein